MNKAHSGFVGGSGIQNHSRGEIYPLSIVGRGRAENPRLELWHLTKSDSNRKPLILASADYVTGDEDSNQKAYDYLLAYAQNWKKIEK